MSACGAKTSGFLWESACGAKASGYLWESACGADGFRLSFRKSRVPHKTTALCIAEYEFMIPHPMADSYTAKEHFYGRWKAFCPAV